LLNMWIGERLGSLHNWREKVLNKELGPRHVAFVKSFPGWEVTQLAVRTASSRAYSPTGSTRYKFTRCSQPQYKLTGASASTCIVSWQPRLQPPHATPQDKPFKKGGKTTRTSKSFEDSNLLPITSSDPHQVLGRSPDRSLSSI
jgi:hypothetical protein